MTGAACGTKRCCPKRREERRKVLIKAREVPNNRREVPEGRKDVPNKRKCRSNNGKQAADWRGHAALATVTAFPQGVVARRWGRARGRSAAKPTKGTNRSHPIGPGDAIPLGRPSPGEMVNVLAPGLDVGCAAPRQLRPW